MSQVIADDEEMALPTGGVPQSDFTSTSIAPDPEEAPLDPQIWQRTLLSCLSAPNLTPKESYFEAGISETNPGLLVHGAGAFSLPLSNGDAEKIMKVSIEHADTEGNEADGVKLQTIGMLGPERLILRNAQWSKVISLAVAKMCKGLGIPTDPENLEADLQGLLVLGAGQRLNCFSRSNTAPGFVGALALFLPLENPDGEQLHIQSGDTKTDLAEFSQFETSLLAWSPDASVTIDEARSGFACALLYKVRYIQSIPSTRQFRTLSHEVEYLINAWTKPQNHDVFPGVLLYILGADEATDLNSLSGRDKALASLLEEICEENDAKIFLAHVSKEVQGRGLSSQESPVALNGTSKYQLEFLRNLDGTVFMSGTEREEDRVIKERHFLQENPFNDNPTESEQDRNPIVSQAKCALIIVPRHQASAFALDHDGVGNLEIFLEEDMEDFQSHPTDPGARKNLVDTCRLHIQAYGDSFGSDSGASSQVLLLLGTKPFLSLLLRALTLVGMKPADLFGSVDFMNVQLGNLDSLRLTVLVCLVLNVGFGEVKERLTVGVLGIRSLGVRSDFLHRFNLRYTALSDEQKEATDNKSEVVGWVQAQMMEAPNTCSILTNHDLEGILTAYANIGPSFLERIRERFKAHFQTAIHIPFFVNAGEEGRLPKNLALSFCREVLDAQIPRICHDRSAAIVQTCLGMRTMTWLEQQLNESNELGYIRNKVKQTTMAKLLSFCVAYGMKTEFRQLATKIEELAARANSNKEIVLVYWPFLEVLFSFLQIEGDSWTEHLELRALYATVIERMIQQHFQPPRENWSKKPPGVCNNCSACEQLNAFLKDPNKEEENLRLLYNAKQHLLGREWQLKDILFDMVVDKFGLYVKKKSFRWITPLGSRNACAATVIKIEKLIPEDMLRVLVGEELFALWEQLRQKALPAAPPPLPFRAAPFPPASPQMSSAQVSPDAFINRSAPTPQLPQLGTTPSTPKSTASRKRNLSWPHPEGPSAKKPTIEEPKATPQQSATCINPSMQSANNWFTSWAASRRPDYFMKVSPKDLQVWSMWHHQFISCQRIIRLLNDDHENSGTGQKETLQSVQEHICRAVQDGGMPFDGVRLKLALGFFQNWDDFEPLWEKLHGRDG